MIDFSSSSEATIAFLWFWHSYRPTRFLTYLFTERCDGCHRRHGKIGDKLVADRGSINIGNYVLSKLPAAMRAVVVSYSPIVINTNKYTCRPIVFRQHAVAKSKVHADFWVH